jgi:class 3 adenylate cyclase
MAETAPKTELSSAQKPPRGKPVAHARTVLFADLTGAPALYQRLGDVSALSILTRCLVVMEEEVYQHRGDLVKTVGEEMLCLFSDCNAAAAAAIAMQQRMEHVAADGSVPLGLRVGLHCGPLIEEHGDVFGDGVNLAARLLKLAGAGQILTDAASLRAMRAPLRRRARSIERRRLKGKSSEVEIVELGWRRGSGDAFTTEQATPLERSADMRIVLKSEGREIAFDNARGSFTIGRDAASDLPVSSRKASRQHARIEWRRDKFVLFDHSTNGTYVCLEGEQPVLVKHESFLLRGRGLLGIGEAFSAPACGAIEFACSVR